MKLLYINNYNCSTKHRATLPDNHMWGVDRLMEKYDVTAAKVPVYGRIGHPRIREIMRNMYLALRYRRFRMVYSACGELTDGFAILKKLGLWHGRLVKIQHHSYGARVGDKSYDRILYISPVIRDMFDQPNSEMIEWGGDDAFVERCRQGHADMDVVYDFVSAGKSARDYDTMINAAQTAGGKSLIITDYLPQQYDKERITVISGKQKDKNSLDDMSVYRYCMNSRFIVVPCKPAKADGQVLLAGLTSFADAAILGKPVLISDSTNMGVDVDGLGIGLTYKAGDYDDMASKMQQMLKMSDTDYETMCANMKNYAKSHNYTVFCDHLLKVLAECDR